MADIEAMVKEAYAKFGAGDVEGLLDMFHDDAMFYVPGQTRVSGDHEKSAFVTSIAAPVMEISGGSFKEDILDIYTSDHGAAVVLHHSLTRDGQEIKVGHLNGRSRPYHVTMRYAPPPTASSSGWRAPTRSSRCSRCR